MISSEMATGDRVLVEMIGKEGLHWCKIIGFGGTSEEIEVHLKIDDALSTLSPYAPLTVGMDEIVEHEPAPRDLYEDAIEAVKKAKKAVKALQKSLPKGSGERHYLMRTLTMIKRSAIDISIIKEHTKGRL